MKTKIILTVCFIGVLLAIGCAPKTTNIDMTNDEGKPVLALDYRDFDRAASQLVQSMLNSGALAKKDGGIGMHVVKNNKRVFNPNLQTIRVRKK